MFLWHIKDFETSVGWKISAYDAHIQEQLIAFYDMLDFSKTKKWQKNKNRQVSFFVKYMLTLNFFSQQTMK